MILQEIIRRRKAFLTAMAELLRRRRAIQGSLPATDNLPEGSIAGLSTDYLRTADAVERMQHNLEKDHSLVRRFTGGIVHQVSLLFFSFDFCTCTAKLARQIRILWDCPDIKALPHPGGPCSLEPLALVVLL